MKRRPTPWHGCIKSVLAVLLSAVGVASGTTFTNTINNFAYSPASRTINVGDTIVWLNQQSFVSHSVTGQASNAPPEVFCGSGTFSGPTGFCSHTFTNAGDFGYFCVVHFTTMFGTVTVVGPSVTITNPIDSAKFRAPADIPLMVKVSDPGASVTNVQFFSGASPFGHVTVAPFDFTLSNAPAGNYGLSARATDNRGVTVTSAVVSVFVLTNAVLQNPTQLTNGQFKMTVLGIAGQTYATEVSSNLNSWTAIATNVAPANAFDVTDTTSTNILRRFYRTRQSL